MRVSWKIPEQKYAEYYKTVLTQNGFRIGAESVSPNYINTSMTLRSVGFVDSPWTKFHDGVVFEGSFFEFLEHIKELKIQMQIDEMDFMK